MRIPLDENDQPPEPGSVFEEHETTYTARAVIASEGTRCTITFESNEGDSEPIRYEDQPYGLVIVPGGAHGAFAGPRPPWATDEVQIFGLINQDHLLAAGVAFVGYLKQQGILNTVMLNVLTNELLSAALSDSEETP